MTQITVEALRQSPQADGRQSTWSTRKWEGNRAFASKRIGRGRLIEFEAWVPEPGGDRGDLL